MVYRIHFEAVVKKFDGTVIADGKFTRLLEMKDYIESEAYALLEEMLTEEFWTGENVDDEGRGPSVEVRRIVSKTIKRT